ncbi:hypothetical protein FD754_021104 [Muntiacus muntjak]|uniref:Tetrahydrofolate dehydrogenase/cyclohydrolase NAD(P)-binding domain-containing protein n=1 Tax=Muntiacus muntjak TaxID=9888 RepID=A0A5N3V5F0_MUNMU|nr:hypothetical protein FD754_021104 [Muntiacus muntjak]
MTVVARGFWLLRGRLARVSALSRSAVSPFAAPGAAGQAFRGFRSSGNCSKEVEIGVRLYRSLKQRTSSLNIKNHVDERTVCNGIAPEKDVDGFHIINIGRLCLDQHSLIPATASAVWEIIRRTGIETFGKNVVVAGRSKNVGMPIAMLLHTDGEHERPGGNLCVLTGGSHCYATETYTHRKAIIFQLKLKILKKESKLPKAIQGNGVQSRAGELDTVLVTYMPGG